MAKFFSSKQIFFTSAIAGPLPASFLLAKNLLQKDKKTTARLVNFLGYFVALSMYIGFIFLDNKIIAWFNHLQVNLWLGVAGAFLIIVALQSLVTLLFSFKIKQINNNLIKDSFHYPKNTYSIFSVLPYFLMGLIITAYFMFSGTFHFMIFVIYALPNIYLYYRLKHVFVNKQNNVLFKSIFIALVALYPLANMLQRYFDGSFFHYLVLISDYYLPVMLYFFLLYLFVDLIFFVIRKMKIVSDGILKNYKSRIISFGVISLMVIVIIIRGVYNFNNTTINEYFIEVEKMDSKINNLKIAMAADLHLSEITNQYFMDQFIEKINATQPDIVLFAGDIVESDQSSPKMKLFEKQLRKIESNYGVFAVEGNHDLYRRNNSFNFIKNAHIQILRDTVITIDSSFQIIGRRDKHHQNRKSVSELLESVSDSLPVILLDHQPYYLENAYNNGIDVQFSGHTHHGQMFPINYITEMIYELSWGYQKIKNTHFFVTCGAQGWGPQVKTASQSEIMLVNISFN